METMMRTGRQRVWLTAMAVAGSVALYGCGGGSGGPDTTPFDQDYVDQKVDEAKKAEEERLAAIRAATEAAGKAATAAGEADQAARDAEAAAKAAATHAVYGTLDADEAAAQSTIADNAKKAADAALVAANDALAEADAVLHSDPEVTNQQGLARASATAAAESARDAEKHANAASTSAQVAQATKDGINAANKDAQEQGKQRQIAANKAEEAATAAGTAAEKATEARAARDAVTAADTAVAEAEAAVAAAEKALADNTDRDRTTELTAAVTSAKADLATKQAAQLRARSEQATAAAAAAAAAATAVSEAKTASDEAATAAGKAGDTEEGSPGAMSAAAAAASHKEARASANTAQAWSDIVAAIKARRDATDLEAPLADILTRIPWARDYSRATDLSDQLEEAQHAAERLAQQKDPDSGGTSTYQEDVRRALKVVTDDAAGMTEALAAARVAHDAAKPWSENGRAVDNATGAEGENLATGAILINEDGRINLGGNTKDDPATTDNERTNVVADATSPPGEFGGYDRTWTYDPSLTLGIVSFNENYQLLHQNRWGSGIGEVYDYVSYGMWATAEVAFTRFSTGTSGSLPLTGAGTFALVKNGAPATAADMIGTATFDGYHVSILGRVPRRGGATTITFNPDGVARATVNFADKTAQLAFWLWGNNDGDPWYRIDDLTVSGNILSGGKYVGDDGPLIMNDAGLPSVHAGIFGDLAQEIAGTISVSNSNNTGTFFREWVDTAFAARNVDHN